MIRRRHQQTQPVILALLSLLLMFQMIVRTPSAMALPRSARPITPTKFPGSSPSGRDNKQQQDQEQQQTAGASSGVSVEVYDGPSLHDSTKCRYEHRIRENYFVTLHYNATIDESSQTGRLGQLVDSTHRSHTPFPEPIMVNMSDDDPLLGWSRGLLDLCSGDYVYLVVPPDLAYGDTGDGDSIPGGATLRLDIHILAAHSDPEMHYKETRDADKMFSEMDSDGNGKVTMEEMELFLNVPQDYPNREAFVKQHFTLSDYNKDGTVSLEEFRAILKNWEGIDEL